MNTNKFDETKIGIEIKTKFKFNVVKHLKLIRCSTSLIRSFTFLIFARNNIGKKNLLQSGSDLYYSAFHLAAAAIFLLNMAKMSLNEYLLLPHESSDTKKRRLMNMSHTELQKNLLKISGHSDFKENLLSSLKILIELRELVAYGPYFKLLKEYDVTEKNIGFLYTFYQQKEHIDIHKKTRKKDESLFVESSKICNAELNNLEQLIDQFFEIFLEKSITFGNHQSVLLSYAMPTLIPSTLSPFYDKSTLNEVLKKIESLSKKMGNEEKKMFVRGKKKLFESNRKSVEKDQLTADIRMGFSIKRTIGSS